MIETNRALLAKKIHFGGERPGVKVFTFPPYMGINSKRCEDIGSVCSLVTAENTKLCRNKRCWRNYADYNFFFSCNRWAAGSPLKEYGLSWNIYNRICQANNPTFRRTTTYLYVTKSSFPLCVSVCPRNPLSYLICAGTASEKKVKEHLRICYRLVVRAIMGLRCMFEPRRSEKNTISCFPASFVPQLTLR